MWLVLTVSLLTYSNSATNCSSITQNTYIGLQFFHIGYCVTQEQHKQVLSSNSGAFVCKGYTVASPCKFLKAILEQFLVLVLVVLG